MAREADGIRLEVRPAVSSDALNELFHASWPRHEERDFGPVLRQSLSWVCAYEGARLVGFVNIAWDGGYHGFILDTTVRPEVRRTGVGVRLVRRAAEIAREHGLAWLHVDYVPGLEEFYARCGFRPTAAGLIDLRA